MLVELTYFTDRGKYYSGGNYQTSHVGLHDIRDEVRDMQRQRKLPGLCPGHSPFFVLIGVPDHPHDHPHLVTIQEDTDE